MSDHPLWLRPDFVDTGAHVTFRVYAFSSAPFPMDGMGPADDPWCPFSDFPGCIDLGLYARPTATELFDTILGHEGRLPLAVHRLRDPELSRERFARAQHCACIEVDLADAADLGYLQCVWAMARWLVRRGADVIFDDRARAWHLAEDLLAWPTPLEPRFTREVTITIETDHAPGRGNVMHTRGMLKLGRPDLVAELRSSEGPLHRLVETTEAVMTAFGTAMMRGLWLPTGTQVELEGQRYLVSAYQPGQNAPAVDLGNAGLLLSRVLPT